NCFKSCGLGIMERNGGIFNFSTNHLVPVIDIFLSTWQCPQTRIVMFKIVIEMIINSADQTFVMLMKLFEPVSPGTHDHCRLSKNIFISLSDERSCERAYDSGIGFGK